MASTLKCPFCGGTLLSNEKNCPHCGGKNANYVEDTPRRIFHPKTIAELKEYCAERGMPLLRMRFFVGQDYREPKAFGIYKAGENRFVVYKNKADGTRAVRYDGPDEAHAVNELFEKLLSECHNRGIYPDGAVSRASGGSISRGSSGSSSSQSSSGRLKKWTPLFIIGFFILMPLLNSLSNWASEQSKINEKINTLRTQPNTYDSVYIGKQYYTFDLKNQKVVSSSSSNDHLNDGYYREISPSGEDGSNRAVYYRDGKNTWYVYTASECDWKATGEPKYDRLGKTLEYLGTAWQSSWNVPDYSLFPVKAGYYSYEENCYYRDTYKNSGTWYTFQKAASDWVISGCPVKNGVPAESLGYLGTDDKELKTGIRSFTESTPYAIQNQLDGYYRRGGQVYYQYKKAQKKQGYFSWSSSWNYEYCWYTYGKKPDPYIYAEPSSGEWYATSAPAKSTLVYLGKNYEPGWLEQWSVTDFKTSAAGMQAIQINGYLKQENDLYYHYKTSWYKFDTDSNDWKTSSEPSGDGLSEIFLGDTYQGSAAATVADEWDDDWHTTDFKTSAAWLSIERAEAAEAARVEREREAAQREAERRESESRWNSSDYDDWDIGDTDWDSDW